MMDYVKCLAVNDNELGLKPEHDIHAGYTIVPPDNGRVYTS